jgi:putative sigma-54 modulation protein
MHVHLTLPGEDIVVGKDSSDDHTHEDAYIAIKDSFEAARG